ncbi:Ring finger protein nhl-1, partial [Globisporangium polare]
YAPSEHVKLVPYAFSYVRLALFWLLVACTGSLFGIVCVWFPQLFTWVARARLPYSSVGDADFVLVLIHRDGFRSQYVEQKVHRPAARSDAAEDRTKLAWVWFEFKKHRYVYNHEKGEFERYLASIYEDLSKIQMRLNSGLDAHAVSAKMELFGANLVDIQKPRIPMLLFTKIVHPFYLFQVFSAVVWFFQDYTVYAVVVLVMSAASLAWEIYSEVSNSNRLRSLVRSDRVVEVIRGDARLKVHETELVPGDIVAVVAGPMVADLLLLSGACVADEASLTGEALPVNKEPASGSGILTETNARTQYKASFLHAGSTITRVRETSGECRGVVLSTGFSTGKGELFRSIIFPKPISFEFERDSYRYLAVLAAIAIAAFIKRAVEGAKGGSTVGETIVNSLDLITIAVPPALPIVLSSGIGFALSRLKKGGIFCIDAQRINSCGQLSCFCFDKTGTLTQEHLNLVSVDVVDDASHTLQNVGLAIPEMFRLAMATCHGLSETQGQLQGYSLDLAMFEASQFAFESTQEKAKGQYVAVVTSLANSATETDKPHQPQRFGIVKRFAFDAACQLSSVVVEDLTTSQRFVFVKGSPEAIRAISTNAPADLHHKTLAYSAEGYYCIGFGVKALDASAALDLNNRQAVESAILFEGLAVFKNELKPETKGMIDELYVADIDIRMITGDNALTAVHVARELDMKLQSKVAVVDVDEATGKTVYLDVDSIQATDAMQWLEVHGANLAQVTSEFSIAITGAALDQLHRDVGDETMKQLLRQTLIFARIRPQQKTWIVEQLMELGLIVGMCGDGTNDCGALKAAHVGLALSSAEASIVAPFTSRAKSILDVPVLIREGRCALTTSFLGFKFMVLYPVIQLGMASTLAQVGLNSDLDLLLSNNQYLWDDLAIVLVLAITMLYTGSSAKLSKEKPPRTLFSLTIVASILGQVALFVGFFAVQFAVMANADWFCDVKDGYAFQAENDTLTSPNCQVYADYDISMNGYSYEDSTVWLYGHLQYIAVAAAFNVKDPFRLPFYSNKGFTLVLAAVLAINLWFLLDFSAGLSNAFQIMPVPQSHRWVMLALFCGN